MAISDREIDSLENINYKIETVEKYLSDDKSKLVLEIPYDLIDGFDENYIHKSEIQKFFSDFYKYL